MVVSSDDPLTVVASDGPLMAVASVTLVDQLMVVSSVVLQTVVSLGDLLLMVLVMQKLSSVRSQTNAHL
jgi:hypothetical protein